jgi:hypothetical protein
MSEAAGGLILEPYAVEQRWQTAAPLPGTAWQELLGAYLADLARACAAWHADPNPAVGQPERRVVIGHIKALAIFPDGGYLRISAVSTAHPPTSGGQVPDGLAELKLTLNVLVYGLPRAAAQALAHDTALALATAHACQVTEEDTHDMGHPDAASHLRGNHPHTHAE